MHDEFPTLVRNLNYRWWASFNYENISKAHVLQFLGQEQLRTTAQTYQERFSNPIGILEGQYNEEDLLETLLQLKEHNPTAKQSDLIIKAKKLAYQRKLDRIDLSSEKDDETSNDEMLTGFDASDPSHDGTLHMAYALGPQLDKKK